MYSSTLYMRKQLNENNIDNTTLLNICIHSKCKLHPETDAFALTHCFLSISLSLPVLDWDRESSFFSAFLDALYHHRELWSFFCLLVFVLFGASPLGIIIQWIAMSVFFPVLSISCCCYWTPLVADGFFFTFLFLLHIAATDHLFQALHLSFLSRCRLCFFVHLLLFFMLCMY